MTENILTIDTDSKGAICLASFEHDVMTAVEFWRMPTLKEKLSTKTKIIVDGPAIFEILFRVFMTRPPDKIVIERQWGHMGQAAGASFSFGRTYGTITSAAMIAKKSSGMTTEFSYVPASTWKRKVGVTKDKGATKQFALDLIADWELELQKKLTITQAETVLMAVYAKDYIQ